MAVKRKSRKRRIARRRRRFVPRFKSELKIIYNTYDNSGLNITPVRVMLTSCAQGLDINQRIGRRVYGLRILLRCAILTQDAAGVTAVRMVIVRDKDSQIGNPVWTDIFMSALWNAYKNNEARARFRFLYDKMIPLYEAKRLVTRRLFIPIRRVIRYEGTTSGATGANNVYIFFCGSSLNDYYTVSLSWQFQFFDA